MKQLFLFLVVAWLSILTFGVLYSNQQSIHRDVEIMEKVIVLQNYVVINSKAIVTIQKVIIDSYGRLEIK